MSVIAIALSVSIWRRHMSTRLIQELDRQIARLDRDIAELAAELGRLQAAREMVTGKRTGRVQVRAPGAKLVVTRAKREMPPGRISVVDLAEMVVEKFPYEGEFTTGDVKKWLKKSTGLRPSKSTVINAMREGLAKGTIRLVSQGKGRAFSRYRRTKE